MNLRIPDVVLEAQSLLRERFVDPGLQIAMRAFAGDVSALKDRLDCFTAIDLGSIDVEGSFEDGLMAAYISFEAGRVACPVPVAALLTARVAGVREPVHAVADGEPLQIVDYAGVFAESWAVDLGGKLFHAAASSGPRPRRLLAPLAGNVHMSYHIAGQPRWWALHEAFSAFNSLGVISAVLDLTRLYANERKQFGKPLRAFQVIEHRYADMRVAYAGLFELCHLILWRLYSSGSSSVIADAAALRLHHLQTLRDVLRDAHQTHGAIGFCDEHQLSLYSKTVQARMYVPLPLPGTLQLLTTRIDEFLTLYPVDS